MDGESLELVGFLSHGANEVFENAKALYDEATLLANEGCWARALFLHQISLEECAKIEILGAAVTATLLGQDIEVPALQRAFGRHERKNRINAYSLPATAAEDDARKAGDLKGSRQAFNELQDAFHEQSNNDKNGALYVDFRKEFTSPLHRVSEEMFQKVRALNDTFLGLSQTKINLLYRWSEDWTSAAKEAGLMVETLNLPSLKLDGGQPFSELADEMIQRIKGMTHGMKGDVEKDSR